MILKTWNFFALKPFSGQIAPFSRSKKPPQTVPKGGSSREPQKVSGGVAPEQGPEARDREAGRGGLCATT